MYAMDDKMFVKKNYLLVQGMVSKKKITFDWAYLTIFGCLKASSCFNRAISLSVDIGTPSSVNATLTLKHDNPL